MIGRAYVLGVMIYVLFFVNGDKDRMTFLMLTNCFILLGYIADGIFYIRRHIDGK